MSRFSFGENFINFFLIILTLGTYDSDAQTLKKLERQLAFIDKSLFSGKCLSMVLKQNFDVPRPNITNKITQNTILQKHMYDYLKIMLKVPF